MSGETIDIAMIGLGTVGGGVVRMLARHGDEYTRRLGRPLRLRRVLVRNANRHRQSVNETFKGAGAQTIISADIITDDVDAFFSDASTSIMIEVAGGIDPVGDYVRRTLESGNHVVTANKSLLAACGVELFDTAARHNASLAFEASCAGGIPIVTSLLFGLAANRVSGLYGILNGTCNYILTQMTQHGTTYADALTQAQQLGFAEADPSLDVTGQDAAQKLAILAALAFGTRTNERDVTVLGIDTLDLADIKFGAELGYNIKLLGIAERSEMNGRMSLGVQPCFVHRDEPIAQIHGSFNAVSVYGDAVGHVMQMGRGAGQMPTASAVVSDLINIAAGWYPRAFAKVAKSIASGGMPDVIHADELTARFYLRFNMRDEPGVMAKVATILGTADISISAALQHEQIVDGFVPVVVVTHNAKQGRLREALSRIEALDTIYASPVSIRIVDLPDS